MEYILRVAVHEDAWRRQLTELLSLFESTPIREVMLMEESHKILMSAFPREKHLRMAAIYTVSWAVLASMIGLGGLGDFVYRGTSSNNNTLILLGAIPAAILAVLFGLVIDLLQKRVTPRGLRKEAGK